MEPIKVIQIAAYESNIGDNANISGIRSMLDRVAAPRKIVYTDWDIVNISWGLDTLDNRVSWINEHDILLIGGGGFFELIPGSKTWTGTRINLEKNILDALNIPIIFYALGMDTVRADLDGRDISSEISKFREFLRYCTSRKNILLSTRHDGSMHVLDSVIGDNASKHFHLIGDGGFFSTSTDHNHIEIEKDKKNIAINLGGDLIDARYAADYPVQPQAKFPLGTTRPVDYEVLGQGLQRGYKKFLISFSNVLRQLSYDRSDVNYILTAHIYRDIQCGSDLLSEMGFPYCRREMKMAPYVSGFQGKDYIIDLYKKCDLVIGTRLHANVCPIGLETPSIGLGTFPMIKNLYHSLNLDSQYIQAGSGDAFEEELYNKMSHSLNESTKIKEKYRTAVSAVKQDTIEFQKKIISMI